MKKLQNLVITVLVAGLGVCHADFKYTQSSKMTGGSLIGMTKALGVFSKSARQINEPQLSTVMVKGNHMRSEHANGQVQIIDLDGRRFINIDSTKKTYSTMTFEEFKAAMQRAQERAKEEQAKAQAQRNENSRSIECNYCSQVHFGRHWRYENCFRSSYQRNEVAAGHGVSSRPTRKSSSKRKAAQ